MTKNKPRILLIDDSSFDRDIIEKRLSKLSFDVHQLPSAKEALTHILTSNFDIILMDLVMEDMDGITALTEIRKMYSSNELPIIIMTASNDEQSLIEAFASGANDYLVKPINFQAMVARIDSLLAIKQAAEEMHKALEQAEKINIEKNRFLFKMTKEIKNPLNSILGMSNLMYSTELDSNSKRYLDIIQSSGENLLSLLGDILELSNLEGKQVDLNEVHFNLNELVFECFELTMNTIQNKNVDLIYHIDDRIIPFVFGDSDIIQRILIHLLTNALKFTDNGEIFLHISPSEVEGRLIISLSDTGKGMTNEFLDNIFDHFVHESSDISTQFGSYGLGLSLCKRNIEFLGGDIIAESEEGVGTTFYLEIPLEESSSVFINNDYELLIRNVEGLNILIIDDNETTLSLLKNKLEKWKAIVTVIDSGEKGLLELLRSSKTDLNYDLIFIDEVMPRMGGFDVIKRLDQVSPLVGDIILMLNALPNFCEKELCQELKIKFTILKPLVDKNLLTIINDISLYNENLKSIELGQDLFNKNLNYNLLIVDDMQEVLDVISNDLEDLPFRVFTTIAGLEAVKIIKEQNIDIVLIDYKMPKINGIELIHLCHEEGINIKFIMTSSYLKKDEMIELTKGLNVATIEKPFKVNELIELINPSILTSIKKAS